MIRFYSLFVSDEDLLASPYVQKVNVLHDLVLCRGEKETVNFLLQSPLTKTQKDNLNVICDPLSLVVNNVEVKAFKQQTIISITLSANEVGSAKIGIAFPQSSVRYKEQIDNLPSPLVSIPYELNKEKVEA